MDLRVMDLRVMDLQVTTKESDIVRTAPHAVAGHAVAPIAAADVAHPAIPGYTVVRWLNAIGWSESTMNGGRPDRAVDPMLTVPTPIIPVGWVGPARISVGEA